MNPPSLASSPERAFAAAPDRTSAPRRGHLRMPELAAQSIGLVGVSGGIGMLIPAVFSSAGPHVWLAYVFAIVALLFVSWSISFFARQTASSGALYSFAAKGLGTAGGLICGSCLLIAYAIGAAGILLGTTNTVLVLMLKLGLADATASATNALIVTAVLAVTGWYLTTRDIRISTRVTLVVELLTIGLIAVVIVGIIATRPQWADARQLDLRGLSFQQLHPGIVLAFFSFVGFESATALGHEARSPLRAIPRAVLLSILVPAALFIVASYAMVGAFPGEPRLDQVDGPLSVMAQRLGIGFAGVFIEAGVALSFFVAYVSSVTAGARVASALARDGYLPSAIGRLHTRHAIPHVAVHWLVGLALAGSTAMLLIGVALIDAYGWLSTIATYGYLMAYLFVAVAAPVFLWRSTQLRPVHAALSVMAVLLLCVPLIGSVYPATAGVYAALPYVFAALVALHLALVFGTRRSADTGPTRER